MKLNTLLASAAIAAVLPVLGIADTAEHWDNLIPEMGPNPSGHTQPDGC